MLQKKKQNESYPLNRTIFKTIIINILPVFVPVQEILNSQFTRAIPRHQTFFAKLSTRTKFHWLVTSSFFLYNVWEFYNSSAKHLPGSS